MATRLKYPILLLVMVLVSFESVFAAKIHLIIAADNEQGIVQHTAVSTIYITQAVEANLPVNQVITHELKDESFKTSKILATIDGLHPNKGDSIFFYYVGHGATTEQGKPYMVSGRNGEPDLYVSTAMKRLSARGSHAVVAILDMCSVCPNCNVAGFVGGGQANQVSSLFQSLFFHPNAAGARHCVISSSRGQPALTLAPISATQKYDGGMYSWYFAKHLVDHRWQATTFNALHNAVRSDVVKASKWHPNRDLLTNKYERKQYAVQYNVWKNQ